MIVFIPIKAESQRVPHKNFRSFNGCPLWLHTVKKYVEKNIPVFIDTDSPEVMAITKKIYNQNDVFVYYRHKELAGHEVSVNKLIYNFFTRGHVDEEDTIAQIHVTNPFLKADTVLQAGKLLQAENIDSVVSCDYIQARVWLSTKHKGKYTPVNHNLFELKQTQELDHVVIENSCFYIFTLKSFNENNRNRVGKNPFFYQITWPENIDIDTESDWSLCKKIQNFI